MHRKKYASTIRVLDRRLLRGVHGVEIDTRELQGSDKPIAPKN